MAADEEGHLLDQAYLRDGDDLLDISVEIHSKYYTDHKGLALIAKKGKSSKIFEFILSLLSRNRKVADGKLNMNSKIYYPCFFR